jgi:hypothetical protein
VARAYAKRDDRRVLEQQELIGDAPRLALLYELLLQREALRVRDEPEMPDFELPHAYIHDSSKACSRSLTKERIRPASAPSMSRWS